jgi:hypothetical protein
MLLALASFAHAACDAKALTRALTEAGPAQTARAFSDLAACDGKAAAAGAAAAFPRVVAGDAAVAASVDAIKVGAGDAVRAWVATLQSDERSSTINALGGKCEVPEVVTFFTATAASLGERFWTDRWYAGLDECHAAPVTDLLRQRLDKAGGDNTLFGNVVTTYAANLGKDAIPGLKAHLEVEKDSERAIYTLDAFLDAAGVGSMAGTNAEAASMAIAAMVEVAPKLPLKALEAARKSLAKLGQAEKADALAALRFADAAQKDGTLLYSVTVIGTATCKKDTKYEIHHLPLTDKARTWPDQVAERSAAAVGKVEWKIAGKDCQIATTVEAPKAPFKDAAAFTAWSVEQEKAFQKAHADAKVKVFVEESAAL